MAQEGRTVADGQCLERIGRGRGDHPLGIFRPGARKHRPRAIRSGLQGGREGRRLRLQGLERGGRRAPRQSQCRTRCVEPRPEGPDGAFPAESLGQGREGHVVD